jgi:protoheme IX farnesyltransferase
VPMLPVVSGRAETRKQILLYSVLLAPLGVAPWLMGFAGLTYGVTAIAGGAIFLAFALRLFRAGDAPGSDKIAKFLFGYSILYLFVLFAVLLIENRVNVLLGSIG